MNTAFLLLAQYNGAAVIPADLVCRDYFQHLRPAEFARKVANGAIDIPIVRMDPGSNKGAKRVHLQDLAAHIHARRTEGRKEFRRMNLSPSHKPNEWKHREVYCGPFTIDAGKIEQIGSARPVLVSEGWCVCRVYPPKPIAPVLTVGQHLAAGYQVISHCSVHPAVHKHMVNLEAALALGDCELDQQWQQAQTFRKCGAPGGGVTITIYAR